MLVVENLSTKVVTNFLTGHNVTQVAIPIPSTHTIKELDTVHVGVMDRKTKFFAVIEPVQKHDAALSVYALVDSMSRVKEVFKDLLNNSTLFIPVATE